MQEKNKKTNLSNNAQLPLIPDKLYFSIGEVSKLCEIKPHVLRYWEQEFEQLNPTKRRGNRRYYQRNDVIMVRQIKNLLYEKGFTIEGARVQLVQTANAVQTTETGCLQRVLVDLEGLLLLLES